MKTELLLLLSNATSIACVIAAATLASFGTGGWGQFLPFGIKKWFSH